MDIAWGQHPAHFIAIRRVISRGLHTADGTQNKTHLVARSRYLHPDDINHILHDHPDTEQMSPSHRVELLDSFRSFRLLLLRPFDPTCQTCTIVNDPLSPERVRVSTLTRPNLQAERRQLWHRMAFDNLGIASRR